MWMNALWDHDLAACQWGAVIGASLAAAACDVTSRRIPNLLTGPFFLAGLVWAPLAGGLAGLADGLAASILLAAPFIFLFAFAGGGAGDAKLMGALGMWLGLRSGVAVLLAVVLSGLVLAVAFAVAKSWLRPALANVASITRVFVYTAFGNRNLAEARGLMPDVKEMHTIPYGLAIFAGVCLAGGGIYVWGA
jgi:Flp pilus assembly protein protease CpaA